MSVLPQIISLDPSPRRILIIKPSAIGDVVHTLPFLAVLRERFPTAHISWLITPACAGLVEGHPLLDQVIHFQRHRFGAAWSNPGAAACFLRFLRRLREEQFDLVVDLQGLFRSGYFAAQTRAPVRVGFAGARELAHLFYTHRVAVGTAEQHAVDRYMTVARFLGCDGGAVRFPFVTDEQDRQAVQKVIPAQPFAVLLPGSNWRTKCWPMEHFAGLARPLRERFGLQSIVAGGAAEVPLAEQIPHSLNLAGKTSLRELVVLLQRAALVIANDSGPMHIAAGLGRPLVALFGPTNPVRTGPYHRPECVLRLGIDCSPCYSRRCWRKRRCMVELGVDAVLAAAQRQMAAAEQRPATTL